jgi:hypothetical protein
MNKLNLIPATTFNPLSAFSAPTDFAEFFERFPRVIERFAARHYPHVSDAARHNIALELKRSLLTTPDGSPHADCLQMYNALHGEGASAETFFGYIWRRLSSAQAKIAA